MKCHYVWFNSLLLLHLLPRLVSGLRITIEPGPNGVTTVDDRVNVAWNHEPDDPAGFDFRFVIDAEDVGLARANIVANVGESGVITLRFPQPGHYVIMAVSGPENTVIGASNEVEVLAAAPTPTTPATTTQTVTSSTVTVTATSSKVNAESSSSASPKAAVVAGIVIGVILLVALIVSVVFYFFRKRKLSQGQSQRLSFHPEQMVRRRSRFLSFGRLTLRGSRGSTAPDVNAAEQGVSTVTPFPAPPPPPPPMVARSPSHVSIVITSPTSDRAPQLQFKNPFETPAEAAQRSAALRPLPQPPNSAPAGGIRPLPTAPASVVPTREQSNTPPPLTAHLDNLHHRALPTVPRTERQRRLGARLSQVREQLEHLEGSQEQLGRVLEDLRKQEKWLTIQYDSDWALGLTDVLPPGYARYMTP